MTGEVKEWWEATADHFRTEASIDPGVDWTFLYEKSLELLGDVAGKDVLELGCGGGQCTVGMAGRGANVTGIDLSESQPDHARELVAERDVEVDLVQGDVTDLSAFEDESFDAAFNAYVFQWVEDLVACFEETYRVLRPEDGSRSRRHTPSTRSSTRRPTGSKRATSRRDGTSSSTRAGRQPS
jgi:cyclopropane fatty-acyl-phospholipid synthase-like methyltransferase